ncbi:cytochrome c nitrite reductase small subunit [Sulfidibacter corallicola]|uniref:Cytochrome c nitrite reductase small subunit n=1 Tax=Sulfidibacter corallicola TaxID=2818388 RepID=A0A8A4TFQ3_SULCO|nr:cytochrome c nitrite reductase small subunit [Sulfidibacter corallicola]QTD48463.1 cytochrome c nitrite reductase small subunit [Sulfidibacter corallicola]
MSSSVNVFSILAVLSVAVVGISLGTGLYTFKYAEGGSYFSKDPEACVNCHIMRPQFDSWQKSSHKATATCVDCHLPHDFVGKYIAKAENGWNHSKAFTLQDFHEPIMINEKNSQILQDNCIDCHRDLTHAQVGLNPISEIDHEMTGQFTCVHCHPGVGHGERAGLGVLDEYRGRAGLERLKEKLKTE